MTGGRWRGLELCAVCPAGCGPLHLPLRVLSEAVGGSEPGRGEVAAVLCAEGFDEHAVEVVLDACEGEGSPLILAELRETLSQDWPRGGKGFTEQELEVFRGEQQVAHLFEVQVSGVHGKDRAQALLSQVLRRFDRDAGRTQGRFRAPRFVRSVADAAGQE